ncbi:hypothetical protein RUND412_002468 [Rhizina undulata]
MAKDPPPALIASWPPANKVNPAWRGNGLVVVESLMISLVVIVVGLRIYSRVWMRKSFGMDDWFIIPATFFAIGLTTTTCLAAIRYGWGHHMWDISMATVQNSLKLSWISELFFTWSLLLTKLSLCALYLRLLGNLADTRGRRIIYTILSLALFWGIAFTIATIMQCTPIRAAWIINLPGERCIDQKWGGALHAALDIITDWGIYAVGITKVAGMGLRGRQKGLLIALFLLGAFVCILAVVRLPLTIRSMETHDTTWFIYDSYLFSTLETDLAIICASLPSLIPLIIALFPSFGSINDNSSFSPGDSCFSNSNTKYTSPKFPPPAIHGAHGYPLADISTTASSGMGKKENGWWPAMANWGGLANSSEEEIVRNYGNWERGGSSGTGCEIGDGIMKTTVIEQSVADVTDLEKGVMAGRKNLEG